MKLKQIIEECNGYEESINIKCVEIFLEKLKNREIDNITWVKRYITKEMVNTPNLKDKMIIKLEKSMQKGRGGWFRVDCNIELLKELLHKHSMKNNNGNKIDILNFVMFIYFKGG